MYAESRIPGMILTSAFPDECKVPAQRPQLTMMSLSGERSQKLLILQAVTWGHLAGFANIMDDPGMFLMFRETGTTCYMYIENKKGRHYILQ